MVGCHRTRAARRVRERNVCAGAGAGLGAMAEGGSLYKSDRSLEKKS